MNLQHWVLGAVGVVAVMGFWFPSVTTETVREVIREVGANPGPDFFNPVFFRQTATLGGNVFATSSIGAVTYTAATISGASLIQHTAASAVTATLPASSTLSSFAPNVGDVRTIYIAPITSNVTLAAATGVDLNTASSTKVCLAGFVCRLDFVRKTNFDIEAFLVSSTGL